MTDNSTAQLQNLFGMMYGAGLILGIILLILAIWLSLRLCHLPLLTIAVQSGANSSGGTAPQDGVVIQINEAALDSSCPTMIYSHKSCNSLKSGDSDEEAEDIKSCCSICLSDYRDSEVVRVIPHCGHMFHTVCIDQWLRSHATCPICRISPHNLHTPLPQRTLPIPTPTPTTSPIPRVTPQFQGIIYSPRI